MPVKLQMHTKLH